MHRRSALADRLFMSPGAYRVTGPAGRPLKGPLNWQYGPSTSSIIIRRRIRRQQAAELAD